MAFIDDVSRRTSARVLERARRDLLTASKRKRDGIIKDIEPENLSAEEVDENSESGDNLDEEEMATTIRSKKDKKSQSRPPVKRAKTNGDVLSLTIRAAPKKHEKAKRFKPLKNADAAKAIGGLYGEVFGYGRSGDKIISDWLIRFRAHESNAVAEIVNFTLRSAGCHLEVNGSDIEDPDSCTAKLSDIQERYQAQNITEYPLIAKAKGATLFKTGLQAFFRYFILTITEEGILFDNPVLLENIEVWVTTLSSAASRPLRHTATVASLAIVDALAESGSRFATQMTHFLRQSGTESRKNSSNKNRVASIERGAKIASQKQEVVDNLIKDWFDVVFVHRYRDIDPKIRVDCVEALGGWIMTYSDHFLDGSHLRYLGWMLSDSSSSTRLEVIKRLLPIFSDENKIIGLKTFTERFRKRIVEMATRDADVPVRVATIELLLTLRKAGLLEPNDIDSVGRLVFSTEPRVRNAVAPFFAENVADLCNAVIDDSGGREALEEAIIASESDHADSLNIEWIVFKCLAQVLKGYSIDGEDDVGHMDRTMSRMGLQGPKQNPITQFSLASEALYNSIPELENCEALAEFLLYDHSEGTQKKTSDEIELRFKHECKLAEEEEMILLDVMIVAIQRRLWFEPEQQLKIRRGKSRNDKIVKEREATVKRLATCVPQLLKKFGPSPEAAALILRIEHVLNNEVYQELCHISGVSSKLLDDIKKQFADHASEEVIAEASASLLHARSFGELDEATENVIQSLLEDLSGSFRQLRRQYDFVKRGNLKPSSLITLSNVLIRMENLAKIYDCSDIFEASISQPLKDASKDKHIIDDIISLISRGVPVKDVAPANNTLENVISARASRVTVFYFMWKAAGLKALLASGKEADRSGIDILANRKGLSTANLIQVICSRRRADPVRLAAAGALLDITTLFATLRNSSLPSLTNERDDLLQRSDYHLILTKPTDPVIQRYLLQVLDAAATEFAAKSGRVLDRSKLRASSGTVIQDEDNLSEDFDEDPLSESGSDEENGLEDEESRAAKVLDAEQELCDLAAKFVLAILGGVLDSPENDKKSSNGWGPARRQLEIFKTKLGKNFREIVNYLDTNNTGKGNQLSKERMARSRIGNEGVIDNKLTSPRSGSENEYDDSDDSNDKDDRQSSGTKETEDDNVVESVSRQQNEDEQRNSDAESILGD